MLYENILKFGLVFKESLRKLFPIALLFSWLQLLQNLFLSPYSFLAITSDARFFSAKWFVWFSDQLSELSKMVLIMLAASFLYYLVLALSTDKEEKYLPLPLFTFFLTWLLYSSSYHMYNEFYLEPAWLLLGLLGLGLSYLGRKIKIKNNSVIIILFIMITFLTIRSSRLLTSKMTFGMDFFDQATSLSLIGKGPSTLLSVLFWSVLGIIIRISGLTLPYLFQNPTADLPVSNENLNAALSGHISSIPHFHTLYTLRDSFAMLGGLGMILPLLLAVIVYATKTKNKRLLKIGLLTMLPVLADQNIAFILAIPIILEPILIIPMVIVTLGSEILGALLLSLKWLNPAVYSVPFGTPSLIFGFLASNGDWRYFPLIFLIIVLSTLTYYPFLKLVFKKETDSV